MTNSRIVTIAYVVFALLAGFFLEHVLLTAFSVFSTTQPLTTTLFTVPLGPGEPKEVSWATLVGLAISIGGFLYASRHVAVRTFSEEIAAELRKVTWPSLEETRAATIAVIVASLIAAALLGMFDVFWQFLTDKIQNPTL